MQLILCLIFIFALYELRCIQGVRAQSLKALVPSEGYTHSLVADEDRPEQYQLFWKRLNEQELQFEIHCKTTGWVGMGFSPNGGMTGSDIAIGWVKDDKAYIKDCLATAKAAPQADAQQDFVLLDGAEVDGYTILKFKRKLVTCDQEFDKDVKVGTQYMIFAWNNADPVTGNNDWKYHGTNRIQKTTMLLSFKDETIEEQANLPSDTFTYSLRFKDLPIVQKDTYYFCDVFALPTFDTAVHFIQYEMVVNPANKKYVHHLLAYECDADYTYDKPVAQECGKKGLPSYVASKCMRKMIIAWGIGGPYNYTFPKQAGYRFEPSTKPKHLLIEIHYDNPQLIPGIVDDSGVKLYFTKQLRQHDLGLLMLGVDGSTTSLIIPPKSDKFTQTTICYPDCSQRFFPTDGVYAISGFLHTHLAGRSVKTTLVRNGVAIRDLFDNPNYDFNYQFVIDIEPTKLYPGDALITKCTFETNDRDKFTYFGFSTHDEMCYDFVYYYPKVPALQTCYSSTPQTVLLTFFSSLMKEGLVPTMDLVQLASLSQSALANLIDTNVQITPSLVKRFEEFFHSKYNKTIYCGGGGGGVDLYKSNVAHFEPVRSEIFEANLCAQSENTREKRQINVQIASGGIQAKSNILILLLFFVLSLIYKFLN